MSSAATPAAPAQGAAQPEATAGQPAQSPELPARPAVQAAAPPRRPYRIAPPRFDDPLSDPATDPCRWQGFL
ncbi:hypothetical protein [Hymenobacter psoromatis]|uniref:hypothetical protein n=1 Tax=Hymenobacter psoromatis TaxID=1484116 RepID=UPI001CC0931C|nr:hypothetical protein [Hymenobacter psoromatis]